MTYSNNISFSFQYILSIIIIIIVCNTLSKTNPQMNTYVILLVGLGTGYITLFLLNTFYPALESTASNVKNFITYQALSNFNSMGYMHVWPPIFAILLVFVILLYNRQLG